MHAARTAGLALAALPLVLAVCATAARADDGPRKHDPGPQGHHYARGHNHSRRHHGTPPSNGKPDAKGLAGNTLIGGLPAAAGTADPITTLTGSTANSVATVASIGGAPVLTAGISQPKVLPQSPVRPAADPPSVPEPSSALVLGAGVLGAFGLMLLARRRSASGA